MAFENLRIAYKAGAESAKRMPAWQAALPFFVVGVVGLGRAWHSHDLGGMIVSAVLWWVAVPVWVGWTRTKR